MFVLFLFTGGDKVEKTEEKHSELTFDELVESINDKVCGLDWGPDKYFTLKLTINEFVILRQWIEWIYVSWHHGKNREIKPTIYGIDVKIWGQRTRKQLLGLI